MAAANLVVKLLLENDGFDKNIKSAKASIEGFEKVGKNVMGTLTKVGSALGIATTAVEAFQQIVKASQTTSDAWDATIRTCKNSVDGFFTAIATGDFSYMERGFEMIKQKAKEAAAAIDQLGNTTMSYNYFTSKNDAALQTALQQLKDKTLDADTREQARKTAIAIIGEQEEISKVMGETLDEVLRKTVTEKNSLSWLNVSKADIEDILRIDVMSNRDSEKERLTKEYEEYKRIREEAKEWVKENKRGKYSTTWGFNKLVDTRLEDMGVTKEKYKDAILYQEMLVKNGDEWLQNLINIAKQYDDVNRKTATMKQAMNEGHSIDVTQGITTTTTATKAKEAPAVEGSLRWINEEIAKVQKELQNLNPELNPQKVAELQNKLAELENQKRKIEYEVTYIEKGEKQDSVALGKQGLLIDPLTMPEPKIKSTDNTTKVITEGKKASDQWAESLTHVSNILGSVTNMTNEGAGAWLAWGGNILSSVAAAIPMLATLFAAETAVAGATAARSAAETPIVGWLLAGAAVASVLAAVATLPKFADGGIVSSPFTSGDRVLARVNGGEMILNKTQQSNLFNLLDNGVGAGTNKTVQFEIEGKKLVGVLKNYNNKINKAL